MKFKWWKDPKIVKELELTAGQINRIERIFRSEKQRIRKLNYTLNAKETELSKALRNPEVSRDTIMRLTDEVEMIRSQLTRSKVEMFLNIKEVLDPEQRQKLHSIKAGYMRGHSPKPLGAH